MENKGSYCGTGVFSGNGISTTGLFDPKIAGPGTYTINYLFTACTTCQYATTVQFTVNPTPVISGISDVTVLQGGQVNINAKATISSGSVTYKWAPSAGLSQDDVLNPVANPTEDTQYTLTVTSDKLCSAVARVMVNVLKAPVVPNTFTPNGDNINDTWEIKYLDSYINCTIEVFNRYGVRVFYSTGYPIPWDGRYKGGDLPAGTYYYIINPKSGRKAISGYVAIIR
jgi:gliding motility-associated-like protein